MALIGRAAAGGPAWRAVNGCLIPLCLLHGREVLTVEGVAAGGPPHPAQQQMTDCKGSQCGYCTPGFVVSMVEGCHREDMHGRQDWEDQLCGNLCRCTGYRPILDAAFAAAAAGAGGPLTERLRVAPPPGPIDYEGAGEKFFRPASLEALFALRRQWPEARLIAGATELGLDITKRFRKFPVFISLEGIPELRQINSDETGWRIGAAATLTEIDDALGESLPASREMLRVFGSRQIRNRATMGGNLATASPIGDSAPLLMALDASVVLAGAEGERTVAMDEFFVGYRQTALRPGEIIKTILVPRSTLDAGARRRCAWHKVSKRREMDISAVAGCFTVDVDATGTVTRARLAYGGVAATPVRARQTEQALIGRPWSLETVTSVLPILRAEFSPISDVRGSAEYRRGLITDLFRKFFHTENDPRRERRAAQGTSVPFSRPPHESAHLHVTGGGGLHGRPGGAKERPGNVAGLLAARAGADSAAGRERGPADAGGAGRAPGRRHSGCERRGAESRRNSAGGPGGVFPRAHGGAGGGRERGGVPGGGGKSGGGIRGAAANPEHSRGAGGGEFSQRAELHPARQCG